jgi:hypothetical protein
LALPCPPHLACSLPLNSYQDEHIPDDAAHVLQVLEASGGQGLKGQRKSGGGGGGRVRRAGGKAAKKGRAWRESKESELQRAYSSAQPSGRRPAPAWGRRV